jgi:hypothetical protein
MRDEGGSLYPVTGHRSPVTLYLKQQRLAPLQVTAQRQPLGFERKRSQPGPDLLGLKLRFLGGAVVNHEPTGRLRQPSGDRLPDRRLSHDGGRAARAVPQLGGNRERLPTRLRRGYRRDTGE